MAGTHLNRAVRESVRPGYTAAGTVARSVGTPRVGSAARTVRMNETGPHRYASVSAPTGSRAGSSGPGSSESFFGAGHTEGWACMQRAGNLPPRRPLFRE
ncbi:hypothetical protein J2S41_003377 [Catenuloplanes atrovinosus]|uniref:Uncharacterized protein n=1 Tax=Catenuloplanes atrovinosus TaxID=137266 RepID=A0AAE4CB87_9ACTN|nr:hypothetical protein [Catenuloplanes atrovinosus]